MNYIKSFFSFKGTLDRLHFFYGHAVIVLTMMSVAFSVSFFAPVWSKATFELFHPFSSHQNDVYFTLALFSKRIRDIGFSPFWSALIFIPVVGQIAF